MEGGRLRAVFSVISICCGVLILMFLAPIARSNVNTPFLNHLNHVIPAAFDEQNTGIRDPHLNKKAHFIWQKVVDQGFALHSAVSDKEIGTIFSQIQAHIEYQLIEAQSQIPFGDAIMIIHTPVIATPLVTTGELTPGLVSPQILANQDKTRIHTALSRAKLMRDFLAKGGIIIATYELNAKNQRSPEQIAVFNALKKQYPKQLIEFAVSPQGLHSKSYPVEMIGATYLMRTPSGNIFEMTNRGVQINDARNEVSWGVWLQERQQPTEMVNQRLCAVFQFLEANGLQDNLSRHAKAQGIAPEKYLALLERYLKIGEPANIPCNK